MNTLIELADAYAQSVGDLEYENWDCGTVGGGSVELVDEARAALVKGIEALQAEVERLKSERDRNLDSIRVNNEIINKKNAELDKLKGAEPVAVNWKELALWWESGAEQWDGLKDIVTRMIDAKLAAPQAPAPQWQPIETAPKDGTCVLLFDGATVTAGIYDANGEKYPWFVLDERDSEFTNGWQDTERYGPEFWMPLPAAPEAT